MKQSCRLALVPLLALLLVPAAAAGGEPDTWPQWRGPGRDGQASGPAWPAELSPERLELLWRVELGPSYSGPIVAADRVFTTETRDQAEEVVTALDRKTGEVLWQTGWEGALKVPFFAASRGSWIRSTPAYDGESLFVAGMRDVLVCLDAQTGEERWALDFPARDGTELPSFGFVCSPLVVGDDLFVQAGAAFCKLDKRTGETVWRALVDAGGMNGSAFSSPILAELHGRTQLVVQSRTHLAGVDPDSGEELWSRKIEAFRGMNILTPTIVGDAVFTAPYGGRAQLLDLAQGDEGWSVEQRWDSRPQGYMTSPVVIDGHAYLFLRSNRFACLRLEDGEVCWISPPTGDEYWSLVAQGDRILALTNTGALKLLRANPEAYELLAEVPVAEADTWGHLATSGSELFVRELNALASWRWTAGESRTPGD